MDKKDIEKKQKELKKHLDKYVKPEAKEKVAQLFEEGKNKVEVGTKEVGDFFEKIGDYLVDGSHEAVNKIKEEIDKIVKKDK